MTALLRPRGSPLASSPASGQNSDRQTLFRSPDSLPLPLAASRAAAPLGLHRRVALLHQRTAARIGRQHRQILANSPRSVQCAVVLSQSFVMDSKHVLFPSTTSRFLLTVVVDMSCCCTYRGPWHADQRSLKSPSACLPFFPEAAITIHYLA
ncbi:hypothetical protein J1614_008320 [Plenodomus biglobosus]|nr:hypothetical protein J1614_008320 [Plenodomus biglobosus]